MHLPTLTRIISAFVLLVTLQTLPAFAESADSATISPPRLCVTMQDAFAQKHIGAAPVSMDCPGLIPASKKLPHAQKQTSDTSTFMVIDGIDFGDDESVWSNDGECDDPRFSGEGSAVELNDEDQGHDATDCSTLYRDGKITLRPDPGDVVGDINFGDNESQWADDGECDDPRFNGEGSADSLFDENIAHDANDCRTLFLAGKVEFLGNDSDMEIVEYAGITFGDNLSDWSNDGECDDPRFEGNGMAGVLSDVDLEHDANDCLALFQSGDIHLTGNTSDNQTIPAGNFGDDSSEYANNGECDDPRYDGPGMADVLSPNDMGHDATDCQTLFSQGHVEVYQAPDPYNADGSINFGDDSSAYANDGECDDPRFEGSGMAEAWSRSNILRDASDCEAAYNNGTIAIAQDHSTAPVSNSGFGDNTSEYAYNHECDDPRFDGPGMANVLSYVDMGHDAADCESLFNQGHVHVYEAPDPYNADGSINFGDDSTPYANDGECDDPRFTGPGLADTWDRDNIARDATDCSNLLDAGQVQLAQGAPAFDPNASSGGAVEFGDDSSAYANDGECDDPRFAGEGVASILLDEDAMHDATDCRTLYEQGKIRLVGGGGNSGTSDMISDMIGFGDDSSTWSNDGECDDPRFEGEGMAATLLDEDAMHDATDCRTLFEAGSIRLVGADEHTSIQIGPGGSVEIDGIDFGDNSSSYADNGECDDPLFAGEGAASVLLDEDRGHDSADCSTLYQQGRIHLATDLIEVDGIQFGDNTSGWANDGECDDSRFVGEGAFEGGSDDHVGHDAEDCAAAYQEGTITLKAGASATLDGSAPATPAAPAAPAQPANTIDGIDFGDDAALWANDGECDDPRFEGDGMSTSPDEAYLGHDATDCMAAYQNGAVTAK
ncbi:MAG: hypothetical protein KDJ19_06775 [Hyphomicrobiaceae bacterium]|nr:hypothetical protein [Hyphomicrobiaceae bacterium]MCC0023710.1 hypothetical protein [Hyphomicrobiaceae bacterium]